MIASGRRAGNRFRRAPRRRRARRCLARRVLAPPPEGREPHGRRPQCSTPPSSNRRPRRAAGWHDRLLEQVADDRALGCRAARALQAIRSRIRPSSRDCRPGPEPSTRRASCARIPRATRGSSQAGSSWRSFSSEIHVRDRLRFWRCRRASDARGSASSMRRGRERRAIQGAPRGAPPAEDDHEEEGDRTASPRKRSASFGNPGDSLFGVLAGRGSLLRVQHQGQLRSRGLRAGRCASHAEMLSWLRLAARSSFS